MTTLHTALHEIAHPAQHNEHSVDAIMATTMEEVMPILNMIAPSVKDDDLPVVAMMLSLFIVALRTYPDLTV